MAGLFLAVEMAERRQDSFYDQIGLPLLETVISYELPARPGRIRIFAPVSKLAVSIPCRMQELNSLTTVDWKSFPWLMAKLGRGIQGVFQPDRSRDLRDASEGASDRIPRA